MNDKARTVLIIIGVAAIALILKAAQLQIFDSRYKEQARRTTLAKTTIYPSRGLIYDRNKELIVGNSTTYDIEVIYNNVPKDIDTLALCELLGIDKEAYKQRIEKNWRKPQFHKAIPFVFLDKISPERYAVFQEHLYRFPGFYPVERKIRNYNYAAAGHLLGFLGEVDSKDLEKDKDKIYKAGDYIGRSGLEKAYEAEIRGRKGVHYDLKDNLGRTVSKYDKGSLDSAATAGYDLTTTIDINLQEYGEELMVQKIGAIVAIEPSTGEVLSMISSPSYDPDLLNLNRNRSISYDSLRKDTVQKPLFDRPTIAKYPPGSIFKTVMALIALEKGILDVNRTVYCNGRYQVDSRGRYFQGCHQHPTPHNVGIAVQHSCNSYFFQIFREFINSYGYRTPQIGLDTFNTYLNEFGLGRRLGIDYPIEDPGFVPTSEYYNKQYKNVWRSTYILSLAIGQGEYQFTTLQMANLAAIIANRGYYITPHLGRSLDRISEDEVLVKTKKNKVRISPQYFEPIIDGMSKVATDGTARLAYIPHIPICGKTGTSQNKGEDHSVFFAFAPKDDPKIAIAVFVENAGFGGSVAAPIASLMVEKYLTDTISRGRLWLEERMKNTHLYQIEPTVTADSIQ